MMRLHVRDDDFTDPWQSNTPVLLQHGFIRHGGLWGGWVPYLGRRHRVLRPDLLGCGESPDPGPSYEYTFDRFVQQALQVLDDREIVRVHWVGEGLSSAVAVCFNLGLR